MKDLPDLYNRRLKACNKLESAETSLIGTALKLHNAKLKAEAKNGGVEMKGSDELQDREKALSLAERLVPANERPSHRLPVGFIPFGLPLIGKKVDSIEWARKEIEETTIALEKGRTVLRQEEESSTNIRGKVGGFAGLVTGLDVPIPLRGGLLHRRSDVEDLDLDNERARPSTSTEQVRRRGAGGKVSVDSSHVPEAEATGSGEADASNIRLASQDDETYPPLNSAFVLFHQQIAAHMAAQSLTHHEPYRMAAKYTEVAPADVIWGNLGLNPYETKVRLAISYAVTIGLIIVWAIPGVYHSSSLPFMKKGLCHFFCWQKEDDSDMYRFAVACSCVRWCRLEYCESLPNVPLARLALYPTRNSGWYHTGYSSSGPARVAHDAPPRLPPLPRPIRGHPEAHRYRIEFDDALLLLPGHCK